MENFDKIVKVYVGNPSGGKEVKIIEELGGKVSIVNGNKGHQNYVKS